jgi:hypothetical protein
MAPPTSCSIPWSSSRNSPSWSRRSHQTAPRENLPPERVTVTMPIHPFCGITLAVVRHEQAQSGRRYVTAEHPTDGGNIRLPLDWTDRAAPLQPPRVKGRAVSISVAALRAVARAVEVALRKKLDPSMGPAAPSPQAEQPHRLLDRHARRVGRAVGHDPARPARGVGVPGAKDASSPAAAEVADERKDPAHPSRPPSRRVLAPIDPQAGSRAS